MSISPKTHLKTAQNGAKHYKKQVMRAVFALLVTAGLLLEAVASVPPSGKSGIEYDLVMLGFEWMQTLFEDYWTLAKASCDTKTPGR